MNDLKDKKKVNKEILMKNGFKITLDVVLTLKQQKTQYGRIQTVQVNVRILCHIWT
jgi:hypothetical protein